MNLTVLDWGIVVIVLAFIITVDGKSIKGNILPMVDKPECRIYVRMGKR
jgi:hypothetical protein